VPVLAPDLRDRFGLGLTEVGVVLSAAWVGLLLTMLAWGLAADRFGERPVLAGGLGVCGAALVGAAYAPNFVALTLLLGLAGAAGVSVNAASGRAVIRWFPFEERGLALGVRQTAVPLGGIAAAAVVPVLDAESAFLFLGALCFAGAALGGAVIRDRGDRFGSHGLEGSLRNRRLWLLSAASGFYAVAQASVIGFLVLYLHEERGLSTAAAAAVLIGVQVLAAGLRIAAGRWSDVARDRIFPMRRLGVASSAALAALAAGLSVPVGAVGVLLVAAGALTMAWNGLAYAAAAELAPARSGAAIGLQQTVLAVAAAAAPVAFAAAVSATSWRAAWGLAALFPLVGWWFLRPLAKPRV
jgi:sugar phosphate permease